MPAFIRTPKDEARWSRAKDAVKTSRSKDESSFDDQDWALTNHIYHTMHKAELAKALQEKLLKKDDEEEDGNDGESEVDPEKYDIQDYGNLSDDEGEDLESMGIHEIDPDQENSDEAESWLEQNDPKRKEGSAEAASPEEKVKEGRGTSPSGYSDWKAKNYDEKQKAEVEKLISEGYSPREAGVLAGHESDPSSFQDALTHTIRPSDHSPKAMQTLKQFAEDWKNRADAYQRLNADVEKNPAKHFSGTLMSAHQGATKDYNEAYNKFLASPEVKDLKGAERHKVVQNWKNQWKAQNPEHSQRQSAAAAQIKSPLMTAQGLQGSNKQKTIDDHMSGIAGGQFGGGETFSAQEAAQHVGGAKGEQGYTSSQVSDPAASFAANNPDAMKHLRSKFNQEQTERLKRIDAARATHLSTPKTIRRPAGGGNK